MSERPSLEDQVRDLRELVAVQQATLRRIETAQQEDPIKRIAAALLDAQRVQRIEAELRTEWPRRYRPDDAA